MLKLSESNSHSKGEYIMKLVSVVSVQEALM